MALFYKPTLWRSLKVRGQSAFSYEDIRNDVESIIEQMKVKADEYILNASTEDDEENTARFIKQNEQIAEYNRGQVIQQNLGVKLSPDVLATYKELLSRFNITNKSELFSKLGEITNEVINKDNITDEQIKNNLIAALETKLSEEQYKRGIELAEKGPEFSEGQISPNPDSTEYNTNRIPEEGVLERIETNIQPEDINEFNQESYENSNY
jgi:hypothetical protein